jgi:phage gp36-like protein
MANYVTESDIAILMPQLPKLGTAAYSNTAILISITILEVEGLIDGYLANRYSLPFATDSVPVQIRSIARNLAVYRVYNYQYSGDNINRNAYVERFESFDKNAFDMLEKIRDGEIQLTLTNGSQVPFKTSIIAVRSSSSGYQPIFEMDTTTSQKIDSDLLSDISNSRK